MSTSFFQIEEQWSFRVLRMRSQDGTNRLTRRRVLALTAEIKRLTHEPLPLVITGNDRFFSAGAELGEIGRSTDPRHMNFRKWDRL
jgi:enoyl-CoA hydratase/carnithine racemase